MPSSARHTSTNSASASARSRLTSFATFLTNCAAEKDTLRWAIAEWLKRAQAGNRTVGEVRRIVEREVLPLWGDRPLAEIRKRDVLSLINGIADRGAKTAANRALTYVKHFLGWCASQDMIDTNPAQFVKKVAKEVKRDRALDDGELVEVWRALDGMPGPFVAGMRLLVLTAAGKAEILEARRSELEGDALRLPPGRVKNAQGRIIPLSGPALAIVEALPVFANSPWMLTFDGRRPYTDIAARKGELDRRIQEARGQGAEPMAPWRIHDLRRTCAAGLQRLKVPLEITEAVLGHTSGARSGIVSVYQVYNYADEAREALTIWGDHVMRLLDPTPAKVLPMRRGAR
jgi:integrase